MIALLIGLLTAALAVLGIVTYRYIHLHAENARMHERVSSLTESAEQERLHADAEIKRVNDEAEQARVRAEAELKRVTAEAEQARIKAEAELKRRNEESEERFKLIAREILESNSKSFNAASNEQLMQLLKPLRENLDEFRKTVLDTYSAESRERFSLERSLKDMMELNRTIGREAKELTSALRGNSKVQGDWGELALITILEKSGLKRDTHFTVQQTVGDDGRTLRDDDRNHLRPDVVVNYPDGRCLVVDSKVSLTAYADWANCDDNTQAEQLAKQHLLSVKRHLSELSEKAYQDHIGQHHVEFVLMFIPNEAAYMAAMNIQPSLWQEAINHRVIIVSPTHLVSVIRLVEMLWRQDDIKRNAAEIATQGGRMYDKLVAFVDDMAKVERGLSSAQAAYNAAMNKLSTGTGNLISRAERLRALGATASKRLPAALASPDEPDTTE